MLKNTWVGHMSRCTLYNLTSTSMRTASAIGVSQLPPVVGRSFYMIAEAMPDVPGSIARLIQTSTITSVIKDDHADCYDFATLNSTYRVEFE